MMRHVDLRNHERDWLFFMVRVDYCLSGHFAKVAVARMTLNVVRIDQPINQSINLRTKS